MLHAVRSHLCYNMTSVAVHIKQSSLRRVCRLRRGFKNSRNVLVCVAITVQPLLLVDNRQSGDVCDGSNLCECAEAVLRHQLHLCPQSQYPLLPSRYDLPA